MPERNADKRLTDHELDQDGDVPTGLRYGPYIKSLGRYLGNKLRNMLDMAARVVTPNG